MLDRSQGTEGQLSSVTGASANDVGTEDGSTTEGGGGDSDAGPSNGTGAKPAAQRSRLGPRDTQPAQSQPSSSQSAVASTPCQLHSLLCAYYLACGLVGRCAELVSLMDQPRTGSLTRPIPDHVIQVRCKGAMLAEVGDACAAVHPLCCCQPFCAEPAHGRAGPMLAAVHDYKAWHCVRASS